MTVQKINETRNAQTHIQKNRRPFYGSFWGSRYRFAAAAAWTTLSKIIINRRTRGNACQKLNAIPINLFGWRVKKDSCISRCIGQVLCVQIISLSTLWIKKPSFTNSHELCLEVMGRGKMSPVQKENKTSLWDRPLANDKNVPLPYITWHFDIFLFLPCNHCPLNSILAHQLSSFEHVSPECPTFQILP